MKIHEKYISRCIEIAKNGLGSTFPNPSVGCVIVYGTTIIGEGFTSAYGGPHAEVNAINAVRDVTKLAEATLYVSLEPCSHFGKTPPCADLIIKYKIPRVVVGVLDPHEKVAGKGVEKLRAAGCQVTVGVLSHACMASNKQFFTFHMHKRPYITLKWAETLDGFVAPKAQIREGSAKPYWISGELSRQQVHFFRSREQAILVGTTTVLNDNPHLNVRLWSGKSPTRIVLDRDLKIDPKSHVLDGSVDTIVLTAISDTSKYKKNITYELMDFSRDIAQQICDVLFKYQILSVFIEGGTQTLQTFIKAKLWDEALVFKGSATFNEGLKAPVLEGKFQTTMRIGNDYLIRYTNG